MMHRYAASRFCFVTLVAALATGIPAAARADEAADLLAQHKAYVGWTMGDGSVNSLTMKGQAVRIRDGKEKPIAELDTVRAGFAYRTITDYSDGSGAFYQGFTGSKFWYSSDNGFIIPLVTDDRFDILARGLVFGEAITQLPGVVRRTDTVNGVAVTIVRETPPKGNPIDLYLDPKTGALKRFVVDPEGAPDVVDVDGYSEVLPGKRAITSYHVDGSTWYTRYTDVHANSPTALAQLTPPRAQAHWTFGKGGPIPLKVTDDRIFIDATINGTKGHFILDTGSSDIALTDQFADRIHFDRSKAIRFNGIAGEKKGSVASVDSIVFADGSKLENVVVASGVDMNGEADGLIGSDFFAGAIVDLDFDKSQLTLYDPRTSAPSESTGIIAVADLSSGQPVIPVMLNGKVTSHAILDSGNSGDVLVASELSKKVSMLIDNTQLSSIAFVGGISGGAEVESCGTLQSIVIGPITYQATRACYTRSLARDESLVGIHFLKAFNITFDYPDGKLVLTPRK